jgi:hypothetical protein
MTQDEKENLEYQRRRLIRLMQKERDYRETQGQQDRADFVTSAIKQVNVMPLKA